jgi:Ca2+-binding RTX toxin-like protein
MGRPDPWPSSLDLGTLGLDADGRREGYILEGAAEFDAAGSALAALGDRNGDGVPDVGIGAPGADGPRGVDAGAAILVHGGAATLSVLDAEDGAEDGRIALASVGTIDPAANPLLFAAAPAGGRIDGTAASEVFLGGDGPDTLVGHGGEDSFVGGAGLDRIIGGAGRDRVDAGPGNDVVKTEGGDDTVWLGDGDDTALSGDGDDTVYGGAGDDVIKASLGDDIIHGGEGADNISGWRGRDTIFGGHGDDVIRGDFDEDRIEGGPGNDRLLGGPARDTFVFRMGFDEDRLLDYNPVLEKLDFSLHEGVDSYQDLAISQVGTSVVILDGAGGRIVLAGVDIAQISAGDFIF